jgi:hypothetical protein
LTGSLSAEYDLIFSNFFLHKARRCSKNLHPPCLRLSLLKCKLGKVKADAKQHAGVTGGRPRQEWARTSTTVTLTTAGLCWLGGGVWSTRVSEVAREEMSVGRNLSESLLQKLSEKCPVYVMASVRFWVAGSSAPYQGLPSLPLAPSDTSLLPPPSLHPLPPPFYLFLYRSLDCQRAKGWGWFGEVSRTMSKCRRSNREESEKR